MSNKLVKLKDGSDYLFPQAQGNGIDTSNLIASPTSAYTATEDCWVTNFYIDSGQIKIDSVTIVESITLYRCLPIFLKKGQTFNYSNNKTKVYGVKR